MEQWAQMHGVEVMETEIWSEMETETDLNDALIFCAFVLVWSYRYGCHLRNDALNEGVGLGCLLFHYQRNLRLCQIKKEAKKTQGLVSWSKSNQSAMI